MPKKNLVIAIDLGSSTLKVGLFNADLNTLEIRSHRTPTQRHGARVEIEVHRVWQRIHHMLLGLLNDLGSEAAQVKAIGVTGQRSTLVLWDQQGPLCPALSWQDLRTADQVAKLRVAATKVAATSGLILSAHYMAPKLRWALKHISAVQKAYRQNRLLWGSLNAYIIWQLTAGKTYCMDHAQAQRSLLLNYQTLAWDAHLCRLFDIPKRILPPLRPTCAYYGSLRWQRLSIPIMLSIGDTQAACIAQHLGHPYRTAIQYGSGAFIAHYLGRRKLHCPRLLTTLYYSKGRTAHYFIEGTVNSAASLLHWLDKKPQLPLIKTPLEQTVIIPALSGLGAPHWETDLQPLLFGKSLPTDLRQSAYAAVAYRLREILDWLKLHGIRSPTTITTSGGLSRNLPFMKTQADILGCKLINFGQQGSSLMGVASLLINKRPNRDNSNEVRRTPAIKSKYLNSAQWQQLTRAAIFLRQKKWFQDSLWQQKLLTMHTLLIAHRGAPRQAPENTMASFEIAVARGADGIECDLRMSADHVPIIIHDQTLERTTTGMGQVTRHRLQQLKRLDAGSWFNKRFAESRVPTLEELLTTLSKEILIYLDVKDETNSPALWRRVVKLLDKHRATGRVAVCSFNIRMAQKLKQERSDLCVGAIVGRGYGRIGKNEPLLPDLDLISLHKHHYDEQRILIARQMRQMLFVWTVNHASSRHRLVRQGVDGIVTDHLPLRRSSSQ